MRITRKVFSIYSEDELISAIEEKAFNEGYQAAQKEFAEEEENNNNGSSKRSKALGYGALGAGAVGLGALGYGTKGGLDYMSTIDTNTNNKNFQRWTSNVITAGEKNPMYKVLEGVGKGEIPVDKGLGKLRESYTVDKFKQALSNREGYTKLLEKAVKADPNNKLAADRLSAMKKVNRSITAGRIAGAGALALGAGYGVSRYFDKKKNKQ